MQTFIYFTNTITVGNVLIIGTIISTAMGVYWALKRKWADMESDYKLHIAELTSQQTSKIAEMTSNQTNQIEQCIHKLPAHPETSNLVKDDPTV